RTCILALNTESSGRLQILLCFAPKSLHAIDDRTQLDYLQGTLGPVMLPADDQIAAGGVVAVVTEIAAHEFEFDAHAPPPILLVIDTPFGLAIRIHALDGFHNQVELRTQHAEQIDHA